MNAPLDGNPSMDHDLRSRVVGIEHTVGSNSQRITILETWKGQKDISDAVRDTEFKAVKELLESIRGGVSRLMWMIAGSVVIAIVGWVLSGGLKALP